MSCEICGRSSCTRSFHSLEEQQNFDDIQDPIKDKLIDKIKYRVDRIDGEWHTDDEYWIRYDDVIKLIEDIS